MSIFVTGGTGGIGRHIIRALTRQGMNVTCLSRNNSPPALNGANSITASIFQSRVYGPALVDATAILHMAALTHSTDPSKYHTVNVEGTRILLNEAKERGFKGRFIFMSTRAQGASCGAYGESKSLAEDLVRQSGQLWTILRPAEIYGMGKGEALDKVMDMVRRSSFVLVPGSGEHTLAPVHIDDVVAATVAAVLENVARFKTYNLSGPNELSYTEILDMIEAAFRVRRVRVHVPLALLSAAGSVARLLRLKASPVVCDQIPRLLCPKDADIEEARADLRYSPRPFPSGLAALVAPPAKA